MWTDAEHERFVKALEKFGSGKSGLEWQKIADAVGNRSTAEVWRHAEKYLLKLQQDGAGNSPAAKPRLPAGKWTWEENQVFENALATVPENSNKWATIAALIPTKTANAIQKHYQALLYDVARIEAGEQVVRSYHQRRSSNTSKSNKRAGPIASASSNRPSAKRPNKSR